MGRGVHGVVYSAYDTFAEKKVAVKILSKVADLETNKHEIRIMKELQRHSFEGFPQLIDHCNKKGNYLVSQLLGDRLVSILYIIYSTNYLSFRRFKTVYV